jgi:hypothetical protein
MAYQETDAEGSLGLEGGREGPVISFLLSASLTRLRAFIKYRELGICILIHQDLVFMQDLPILI